MELPKLPNSIQSRAKPCFLNSYLKPPDTRFCQWYAFSLTPKGNKPNLSYYRCVPSDLWLEDIDKIFLVQL